MDELLILGVDPGTTKGYAVLDLKGNILDIKSSKLIGMDVIMEETIKLGKPILVGTDVKKTPDFVERIARSLGAKIFKPKINLTGMHKTKLVKKFLKDKDFQVSNKHENDALISAILAYKSIKPLLKKIEDRYKNTSKKHLTEKIKNLVLKEKINIKSAENLLG